MWRGWCLVAVVVLVVSSCTGSSGGPKPVPTQILSPAPRNCPFAPARASTVSASSLSTRMSDHVPRWLPSGMGLVEAFGSGDGAIAGGYWADGRCREVQVYLFPGGHGMWTGVKVGGWTLTRSSPYDCSNTVLGSAQCLVYHAMVSEGLLDVQMMGIDRQEGDRIVLSIPTVLL
jgi:hypothetical protein